MYRIVKNIVNNDNKGTRLKRGGLDGKAAKMPLVFTIAIVYSESNSCFIY